MSLYVSPNVLYEEIQGFLVILDLRTEAYFILDPVGTSMWKVLLSTDDEAEGPQALQNEYLVEQTRLKIDLEAFRRRCIEHGFLQENEPDLSAELRLGVPLRPYAARGDLLALRAWWCLFRTTRFLAANGFARTYRECERLPIPKEASKDPDDLLKRALAAFAMAENFFVMKRAPRDCMPRSLALFRFLRSTGLPVDHCIGVWRFPFEAHAWVEYHGRVVHDVPSRQAMFKILARISG